MKFFPVRYKLCENHLRIINFWITVISLEDVDAMAYLGSAVSTEGGTEQVLSADLAKPWVFFRKLQKIWSLTSISMKMKLQLYNTAFYASKTWKSTAAISFIY